MNNARITLRRSPAAVAIPLLLCIASLGLPLAGLYLSWSPSKIDPAVPLWLAGAAALVFAFVEGEIRRQLSLAREGHEASAMIDSVRPPRFKNDNAVAEYHFTTAAGDVIHSSCMISRLDCTSLERGARMTVFYDPARPKRNALIHRMWAVHWDDEELQEEAS